jgi:glycerophosphoryl diester phosphodiesterase
MASAGAVVSSRMAWLPIAIGLALLAAGNADAKVTGAVHRGGRIEAPENTLPTFARTLQIGSQWMETDSWVSLDGVLVLHHDIDLCRTTDIESYGYDCVNPMNNPLGRFPFPRDFTLAELKLLDAGSWFDPAFAGERIPTAAEALQLVDGSGYPLLIEIKTAGQGAKFAQVLQQTGVSPDSLVVWDRQKFASPDFRVTVPAARRIVGGFTAAELTDEVLAELAGHGDFGVGLLTNTGVTEEVVDRVHAHGLIVYGYPGASDNMPLHQQIELGVDLIHYLDPQWWVDFLATLPCVDGVDNDGDSLIDFPFDPGCFLRTGSSELGPSTVCENGIDDDGDGLVDFMDDPGCTSASDIGERIASLVCDNGLDDDGDGAVDYPEDDGCLDPLGSTEVPEPATATALIFGVLGLVESARRQRRERSGDQR